MSRGEKGQVKHEGMRKAARVTLAATGIGLISVLGFVGKAKLEGNWDDTKDLMEFTSAEHQEDRCNTQAAADAQAKIQKHFEKEGGISDELAESMAPVVGLTPEEAQSLDKPLYPMDYDCESPVASSQEATTGLLALAGAGGLIIGAVGGATFVAMKRQ